MEGKPAPSSNSLAYHHCLLVHVIIYVFFLYSSTHNARGFDTIIMVSFQIILFSSNMFYMRSFIRSILSARVYLFIVKLRYISHFIQPNDKESLSCNMVKLLLLNGELNVLVFSLSLVLLTTEVLCSFADWCFATSDYEEDSAIL